MDYLIGKCLKATSDLDLVYKVVDGQLYTSSNFYVPKIRKDSFLLITSVNGDILTLQNLSSDDWKSCELRLDDIEDFKVISKDSI